MKFRQAPAVDCLKVTIVGHCISYSHITLFRKFTKHVALSQWPTDHSPTHDTIVPPTVLSLIKAYENSNPSLRRWFCHCIKFQQSLYIFVAKVPSRSWQLGCQLFNVEFRRLKMREKFLFEQFLNSMCK